MDRTYDSKWPTMEPTRNDAFGAPAKPRPAVQAQFAPGDMIDSRYQVISVIGRGGFGCVYKVNQILLRKEFALKTLNPINMSEVTILRLRKEAHAASKLQHPNLVQAVDLGLIDNNQPYLVMELVEGPTLADFLKENGRLPIDLALEIFIPITQGVAYAHHEGVIHRDLKPSNIILAAGKSHGTRFMPKVVDFGIAKIRFADESRAMSLTATGDVFGTPLYMSPEQCAGAGVDARSDIYSLGCMLFEALTGAPPFSGRNSLEVMMQHGSAPLPSLKEASLGEKFPPELERVISTMLAKVPDERYSNAQKVADDLIRLHNGEYDQISTIAQTGAVLSRQQARKQSAVNTALIAVSCTVIGATIGFGAAFLTRPVVQYNAKPASASEIAATSIFGSDVDSAFVSTRSRQDDSRVFEFPVEKASKRVTKPVDVTTTTGPNLHKILAGWGSFHWWKNDVLTDVTIPMGAKPFTVPKGAKLIFRAGYDIVRLPYVWAQFRPDDLYGVILSRNTCSFEESTVARLVRSIALQDDLRILTVDTVTLTPQALTSIGQLQQLRWLDFVRVWLGTKRDSGESVAHFVPGERIAQFACLPNLRVLRLDSVSNVSPVLRALAKRNDLRWLSIAEDHCTDEDLQLVGQLHGLERLNLRGNAISGHCLISALANLKNLKYLIVDAKALETADPQQLRSLTGLTIFVASPKNNPLSPSVLDNLKGCVIKPENSAASHFGENAWQDAQLFDPIHNDPAKAGV